MIEMLSAVAAAIVVGTVVLAAVMGWGERVTRCQRIGLCVSVAGLVLAAPARLYGHGPGLGDLMFLSGFAAYLLARHGRAILKRADRLDGVEDGRISLRPKP
jgi:drug/metabolite transporter (DMT)-like permease